MVIERILDKEEGGRDKEMKRIEEIWKGKKIDRMLEIGIRRDDERRMK